MTRNWVRVLLWLGVILTAGMIFLFSSQDGETSAQLSRTVVDFIMAQVEKLHPHMSADIRQDMAQMLHLLVRKLAHMLEFAALGFFLLLLTRSYRLRHGAIIAWSVGTLYAMTDELHQRFITSRGPAFSDVVIDSIGVGFGILMATIGLWLKHRCGQAKLKTGE